MYITVKHIFDFLLALILLIVFSPLILLLTFVLSITNNGKPFFFQLRPGKNERIFRVAKFKSMNDKRDSEGNLLPDAQRITKMGNFIRKTSMDELPQLVNVLVGDMSFVGPRPLLVSYLPLYNDFQRKRHQVRPGITGWAQVNGRNTLSWDQKFAYDIWYVENISPLLDIKILFKTVIKVLKRADVSYGSDPTIGKFTGNIEPTQ